MGFAAVARVTKDRWITCAVNDKVNFGLVPGSELKIETTICHEIQQHHQTVVIDNVSEDPLYAGHHTPAMYGLQSYISVPIMIKGGRFFGTLCAIDAHPAKLKNTKTQEMFELYAELIAFHLNALEEIELAESKLAEEQQLSVLREQFIAILGHDLRNPVTAINGSVQVLKLMSKEEEIIKLLSIIQTSSHRIKILIDNLMDFASGRMGSGIQVKMEKHISLEKVLSDVVWN